MAYHIFQYPLPCPSEPDELNAFLASHRVASASHHVVESSGGPMIVFVVQTAPGDSRNRAGGKERIDYKQVLPPEQFAVFSQLRDERKKLAEAEGVPVFSIFTNAQLAEMVTAGVKSEPAMKAIAGIGEAKVRNYGARMLAILGETTPTEVSGENES